jgi:hypothetical protein
MDRRRINARHLGVHTEVRGIGTEGFLGDRPPYSEPSEQLVPVAAPEHPIRIYSGLEFGVASMRVHHQVRGTIDIQIREHPVFPEGLNTKGELERRLVKGPVRTIEIRLWVKLNEHLCVEVKIPYAW